MVGLGTGHEADLDLEVAGARRLEVDLHGARAIRFGDMQLERRVPPGNPPGSSCCPCSNG